IAFLSLASGFDRSALSRFSLFSSLALPGLLFALLGAQEILHADPDLFDQGRRFAIPVMCERTPALVDTPPFIQHGLLFRLEEALSARLDLHDPVFPDRDLVSVLLGLDALLQELLDHLPLSYELLPERVERII